MDEGITPYAESPKSEESKDENELSVVELRIKYFRVLPDNNSEILIWNHLKKPTIIGKKYIRIGTIGDGNSLLHAIIKGLDETYRKLYKQYKKIKYKKILKLESLGIKTTFDKDIFTPLLNKKDTQIEYTVVNQSKFRKKLFQLRQEYIYKYRLNFLTSIHDKNYSIDESFLGIFMDYFDVNIYIIDGMALITGSNDLLIGDKEIYKKYINDHRKTLIILSIQRIHYELIGLDDLDQMKRRYDFMIEDPMNQILYNQVFS